MFSQLGSYHHSAIEELEKVFCSNQVSSHLFFEKKILSLLLETELEDIITYVCRG
jgi:hypothetical protein